MFIVTLYLEHFVEELINIDTTTSRRTHTAKRTDEI